MSKLYPAFMNNVVLPLYDTVRGTTRYKRGRILEKTQWLKPQEIAALQTRNLRTLVTHAYESVPYYRRIFKQAGVKPGDIASVDDLVKLPVLTKADITNHFHELVSRRYPRNRLVLSESGGTGNPIKFYITKENASWEIAAEFRAYRWAGYNLGDRCFMFWGSPMDLSKSQGLVRKVTKSLERIMLADTYFISEDVLQRFASLLRSFQPEIVRGYASSVFLMAKYLVEQDITDVRPRAVITSAETLFDTMRQTIHTAFGCPVFDYYGSREIGALAAECEEHAGYHITAENLVMEFVRDGEPVAPGEKGVITVTNLRNFGMPFLRYNMGDVGKPSDEICSCGRGLPLASSIEGRVSEFMAVYDPKQGRIVPVGPVYPVLIIPTMHFPIKHCRMIQERLDHLVVKIVKAPGYTPHHSERIVAYIRQHVGANMAIELEFLDALPPLPSGKRSSFISKVNPFDTE